MTSYQIRYQIRRKDAIPGVGMGEWQDRQWVVVADDDAMGSVLEIADSFPSHDFRLKEVEMCGHVDEISQELLEQIP